MKKQLRIVILFSALISFSQSESRAQVVFPYPNPDAKLIVTGYYNGQGWDNNTRWDTDYYHDNEGKCRPHVQYVSPWIFDVDSNYWQLQSRTTYTYDAQWNLIQQFTEDTIYGGGGWMPWVEIFNTYNENNLLLHSSTYADNNGTWQELGYSDLVYDAMNRLEYFTDYTLQDNEFVPIAKVLYDYSEDGSEIIVTYQYWQDEQMEWVTSSQSIHLYENDLLQQIITDNWDNVTLEWSNQSVFLYFYNTDGLMSSYTRNFGTEFATEMTEYYYNSDGDITHEIHFKFDGSIWYQFGQTVYEDFCRELVSVIENENEPLVVFPNPGNALQLMQNGNALGSLEICLYDTRGVCVLKTTENINGVIQLEETSKLAAGLYTIIVRTDSQLSKATWVKL